MAQGEKWLLCGAQAAQPSSDQGCKPERNGAATKVTVGTVAFWTDTTAALREKGHILTFLLIHQQGRNSVSITVWAASLGMVLSSKVIRHLTEKFKKLVLKVHMAEEGHKNKQLIHNQGLTWGDVLLYFSACCKFTSSALLSCAWCPATGTLGMIELIEWNNIKNFRFHSALG